MKFSFLIAGHSKENLATGPTMDKGDILGCKPAPHEWGKEELKIGAEFIMEVDSPQEAYRLCSPQYDTGKHMDEIPDNEVYLHKVIRKRRYALDLDRVGVAIDHKKLEDTKVEYQPLTKATITKGMMVDKYGIK